MHDLSTIALLKLAVLLAATLAQIPPAPSAEVIARWDEEHLRQAAILGDEPFRSTEPALRSGLKLINERLDPWQPVSSDMMVRRAQQEPYSIYANKRAFRVSAMVDYDGDGHSDLVEMVENREQGAIRVTYGGDASRSTSIIFKMSRHWGEEEIYAAGRRRVLIQKPELGYTLLLFRGGQPRAVYIGD